MFCDAETIDFFLLSKYITSAMHFLGQSLPFLSQWKLLSKSLKTKAVVLGDRTLESYKARS